MKKRQHPTTLELAIVGFVALVLGLAFVLAPSQTYEVWMTYPDHQIVAVYDSTGKKVELSSLEGIKYEVVWVAPEHLR